MSNFGTSDPTRRPVHRNPRGGGGVCRAAGRNPIRPLGKQPGLTMVTGWISIVLDTSTWYWIVNLRAVEAMPPRITSPLG